MTTSYHRPEVKESVRGISKLIEESGELLQMLGKLSIFPSGSHPGHSMNIRLLIAEELADVEAAITFFKEANGIKTDAARVKRKLTLFREWF